MLKTGKVILNSSNDEFGIIWYIDDSNNSNERIDIISDISDYDSMNTDNCIASYIKDRQERCYGEMNVVAAIMRIKTEATFLHVADKQEVEVKDGVFCMHISKESPDAGVSYDKYMENGRLTRESYKTANGIVTIDDVSKSPYYVNDRPINWDDYEIINKTASFTGSEETVKVNQAEFFSYEELLRKYPEVSHVLDNDYVVIRSYEEAVSRLDDWINSKEQLKSVDIESLDKTWGPDSNNRITGVFLGYGTRNSTYFPFRQDNFKYNLPIEFLRKIFDAVNNQPPAPEVIILSHNAKFEIQGFYQEFREYLRVDVDTYLLAVLVDPVVRRGSHTLKNLTTKVDNRFYLSLDKIFIGAIKFNVLTEDIVGLYGCPDATSPAKIFPYLMDKLPKDEYYVMELEMKLPVIKAMNEFYGIRMDTERLNGLIENEQYKVDKLGDMFKKIHHTSRNINSTAVLSEILYNRLRCKVEVRTDKGLPSTSKFAIDRIISTGKKEIKEGDVISKDITDLHGEPIIEGKKLSGNKYPSLVIYQQYKKCGKELGALNRLKNKSEGGFFKFYINQVGAGSNRQTSDAHQFSNTMKSCALADSPHHQLVSSDWAQVELRILAGAAGQKDLAELESDPSVDIHRAILSLIQGKPMWSISEEDRKAGKSVNFGVVYMMTEYGLAQRDFGPGYTKEHVAIERKKISDFFNALPNIKMYLKNNEESLKANGYIKTLFNYYRYFNELLDPACDPKLAKRLIRSGNNTPIQGTGAQMLKIVETKIWNYIREKGWDKEKDYDGKKLPMARMILPIHDEILFSYDKSIPKEEIIKMFKECMELDIKGMPPFFCAPAFINNWLDGKNPVYEVDIEFRDKILEEYEKGNYLLTGKDYLTVLKEYRDGEIREYMSDLISKYKTIDEVAKHVTHDSLTHTLIETMISDATERKKFTHEERIRESVRRYFDVLNNNGSLPKLVESTVEEDDDRFMDADEWTSKYTYIDANGDLVIEETEDDFDDEDDICSFEEENFSKAETPRVIYCMSECLVDLTGLDMDTTAECVNQSIFKLTNPAEFYNLVYIYGDKIIPTKYKIGYREKEILDIFDSVLSKEVM